MSSAAPLPVSNGDGFAHVEKGETLIEIRNLKMYCPVLGGIVFQKAIPPFHSPGSSKAFSALPSFVFCAIKPCFGSTKFKRLYFSPL